MKSILVTGATGFVGRRLIRRLAAQDLHLRVLVRNPDRLPATVRGRVEVVRGELGDAAATDRAMRGVDHVLHLAALATAYTRNPGDYNRLNTDAVEQLLAAAARHGVQRFVHVSSVVALPPVEPARVWGFGGRPTPYAPDSRRGCNASSCVPSPSTPPIDSSPPPRWPAPSNTTRPSIIPCPWPGRRGRPPL